MAKLSAAALRFCFALLFGCGEDPLTEAPGPACDLYVQWIGPDVVCFYACDRPIGKIIFENCDVVIEVDSIGRL